MVFMLHRAVPALLSVAFVYAGVGARTVGSTPDELGAFIKKELATWSTVVKAAGIRID